MFTFGTMNAMAEYLESRGYVKLNPRLYMKNILLKKKLKKFYLINLRIEELFLKKLQVF